MSASFAGFVAPIVFTAAVVVQGVRQPDYSHIALPISALAAWPLGWVQVANFCVTGVLCIVFAVALLLVPVALLAALFLPIWPFLGIRWYIHNGGWMAGMVILQSSCLWAYLIYVRARVAEKMEISRWYAFTTPLGAAVFAAMMITSAVRVLSGKGVVWKGRVYAPK